MNAACDVCSRPTSWEEGTSCTADEFRGLVARGFEPDEVIVRQAALHGLTRDFAVRQWTDDLVARTTTGWLLCSTCAARAARYGPLPAGPVREDLPRSESFEPAIIPPTAAAPPSSATTAVEPGRGTTATLTAPAPIADLSPVPFEQASPETGLTIATPSAAQSAAPAVVPDVVATPSPAAFCPWCGAPRGAADRFCGQCGTDLAAPAPPDRVGSATVAPSLPPGAAPAWGLPAAVSRPRRTGPSSAARGLLVLAGLTLAIGGGALLMSQVRLPDFAGSPSTPYSPSTPDVRAIQAEAAICAPALQGVTNYRFYETISNPDPVAEAALRVTAARTMGSYAGMVSEALAQAPTGIDPGIRADAQAIAALLPLDGNDPAAVTALGDVITRLSAGCSSRQ